MVNEGFLLAPSPYRRRAGFVLSLFSCYNSFIINFRMSKKIITSVLPGFVELLPAEQLAFDKLKNQIEKTYLAFGFSPLDTPTIERAEVLLAKAGGETEKQIYRFKKGENDLTLRFDLTVPLARYVAEHFNNLVFPFRRYQIAKSYRGERPQKGRFREFYQCDIDIIGRDSLDLEADAEVIGTMYQTLSNLDLPDFKMKISNRKLIIGLLDELNLKTKAVEVMRLIDKVEKLGVKVISASLKDLKIKPPMVVKILDFVSIKGNALEIIANLKKLGVGNKTFSAGIEELEIVLENLRLLGIPEKVYEIDLAIARGLDYYTGTVFETNLRDYPEFGSICSGGRYDNLAENYSSQKLPGVGASIGLTRLFSQLQEAKLLKVGASCPANALIIPFDKEAMSVAANAAKDLRKRDLNILLLGANGKFKDKMNYANKLKVKFIVLIGTDEIAGDFYTVKNMESGEQKQVKADDLAKVLI